MPRPLSTVAMGSTNGSASAATTRSATCMMSTSTASPPPRNSRLLSVSPSTPNCTRAIAAPLMAQAKSNSRSSRLRRRAGVLSFSLMDSVMVLRSAADDPSAVVLFADIAQPPDDFARIREVVCGDRLFDLLAFERRQLVELDARDLVDAGELDRANVLLNTLEDRDGVAVGADEVAGLGPAVASSKQCRQQRDDESDGHQPADASTAVPATVFCDEFLQ